MDVKKRIAEITELKLAAPTKENKPVDVVEANEIVSARTATAKVYGLGGGLRRAIVRGVPVHFQDPATGLYLPIDMAVKRKPLLADTKDGTFETVSGLYKAHYPADKPWNYRLEMGDSWVQYEAQFEESEHLDIEVETLRTGIKETITLYDDQAPTKLVWNVSKSGTAITIMPPTAVDARGKDVPVTVTEGKGTLTYDVNVEGVTWPVVIDPTSNVEATNDGSVYSSNATYTTARNAAAGTGKLNSLYVGQAYSGGTYDIRRTFLSIVVPSIDNVVSASQFLYGVSDASTTDFYIYLHTSTYSDTLVKEDFDLFDGHQASGAYNGTVLNHRYHTAMFLKNWNEIVMNSSGRAAVLAAAGSTLKLAIISSIDYAGTAPTGLERVQFESVANAAGHESYMSIEYAEAAAGGGRRPRARYHGV